MSGRPGKVKGVHRRRGVASWSVVVRWEGRTHWASFADRAHGSCPLLSYLAAVAYRDLLEQRLGKPRTDRHVKSPRHPTLPPGVTPLTVMSRLGGFRVFYTPEPGIERSRNFLIPRRQLGDKLVEADCFRQACEFRKEQERLGYGLELYPKRGCKR